MECQEALKNGKEVLAFVVEKDVASDPVFVCFFGAGGVMLDADGVCDLIEKFFALRGWRCRGRNRFHGSPI